MTAARDRLTKKETRSVHDGDPFPHPGTRHLRPARYRREEMRESHVTTVHFFIF